MAYKFIISGGGTGGHIFPAISIANALKKMLPDAEFLFVGAEGRMEMEKVPAAGYKIIGLPVSGFDRKNMLKNISVVYKLLKSVLKARSIIRSFKPDVAIGVGGYASAPVLRAASSFGVATVLQEQNSYAGVTNKLLARKASAICVAYDGMEKFFPAKKIFKTGNPVRQDLTLIPPHSEDAYNYFNFNKSRKTLLIVGGSLGARTVNRSVMAHLKELTEKDIQVIWQTGKFYKAEALKAAEPYKSPKLIVTDFVSRMDYAYAIADLVVSRAGASSVSELCLLAKPVILVPSPNVAEDHQTKNAMALVTRQAALLVTDSDAEAHLIDTAIKTIQNNELLRKLEQNISELAEKNSADRIAEIILKVAESAKKKN